MVKSSLKNDIVSINMLDAGIINSATLIRTKTCVLMWTLKQVITAMRL